MFDSKEIARRALQRAEEIKNRKKRLRRILLRAAALFSVGAAVIGTFLITTFSNSSTDPDSYVILDDPSVPLAAFCDVAEPGDYIIVLCEACGEPMQIEKIPPCD